MDPLEGHPRYQTVRPLSKGASTAPAGSCLVQHAPALASKRDCLDVRSIELPCFAGAFGQVYHCRDLRTGADVAVKLILRGEQMLIKYVRFEVQNHIILRHPNVVDFKVRSCMAYGYHACMYRYSPSMHGVEVWTTCLNTCRAAH